MQLAPKIRRRSKRGFALLMVMILVILLSILVLSFVQDVSRELMVTKNARSDLQAAYLAQMGLIRGQVLLKLDEHPDYDSLNESWSQPLTWNGETWGSAELSGGGDETPEPPEVLISDEERKFNLLTLVRGNQVQRQRAAEVLARLIDICQRRDPRLDDWLDGEARRVRGIGDDLENTDTLVRNLISYLEERASEDSDNLEISVGAAGDDPDVRSMKKQTPYEMLTIGELLQVEGWTEELLFGKVGDPPRTRAYTRRDEYRVEQAEEREGRDWRELTEEERFEHRRDSIEGSDDRSRSPDPLPLMSYLTLYSTGRININTAPREVILALHEDLTWLSVDQIVTAREQARMDVVTAEETGELPYDEDELYPTGEEMPMEEEEDNASFRPDDLANFQAFVDRVNSGGQGGEEEEETEGLGAQAEEFETDSMVAFSEEFTEEIYTGIRPWLVVESSVFSVESSATVDNLTHTIRAIFRRSGQNEDEEEELPENPEEQPTPLTTGPGETIDPEALPPEPQIQLRLLLRDVKIGGE